MSDKHIRSEEKREDIQKLIEELWNRMEGKTTRIFGDDESDLMVDQSLENSQQEQRVL